MTRLAAHHDTPSAKAASMAARALWGTAAGFGLAVLLVGVPVVLTIAFGWPPALPTGDEITYWRLHEADLAWKLLGLAGWAVWAWMAAVLISQIVHALRWGLSPQTLRDTASPARWLAGALIGAVAAAIPTAGASAAIPAVPAATSLDTGEAAADPDRTTAPRPLVWASPNAATAAATTASDTEVEAPANAAADAEGTVHTVQRGENPWTIAERYYGDGAQWEAIWNTNQDTVQPDGRTYTDPGEIHPGWHLVIPDHTDTGKESDGDGFIHETVEDGESLWGYAERYLGDGSRYDEIAEANYGRVQTDGRTLTDPAVIVNGWDILIPTDQAHSPETPAEEVPGPEPEEDPPEGDDGPVPDTPAPTPAEPTAPAPETTDQPAGPDSSGNSDAASEADSDQSSSNPFDAVPFGVWLSGGTCLAAATVAALAARLRRKRSSSNLRDAASASPDDPMTGRLSDLETIIEAENRKLTTPAGDQLDVESVALAVGADRAPVDLRHLTGAGIGLLGPGQHGVARAVIIAAATAGVQVRLTEAAILRLDLDADQLPEQVQLVAELEAATDLEPGGETVVVCADTEIDQDARPALDGFLGADGHGAIILGEWAPATVHVAGDGTVEATTGIPDNLGMLHIADRDTTTALLKGLQEDNQSNIPGPDEAEALNTEPSADDATQEPESLHEVADEPAPESTPPTTADTASSAPHLCLFGTPEVYVGEQPVVFKKGKRAKAFLAALALADEPLSRADLMAAVLPGYDDPDRARTNLNTIGSSLRANLQDATGTKTTVYHWDKATDRYELEPGAFTTDRDAFDAAEQSAALATDPAEAAAHLEEAARLYTGDLAPDLHTPQAEELRDQYRAAAARALRKLADYWVENGDAARAEHYRSRAGALAPEADTR
jgi:nucleoid-associated protein YgaU